MRHRHRVGAAFGAQARGVKEARQPLAVERRGHHHDAQVGAKLCLHVERQGQAEVGGEMPLVELVEQDGRDAVQRRVVLDQPREDAFGDHLDLRGCRHLRFEADAVAHRAPDGFAQLLRHETGGGPRSDTARLEHQDLAPGPPRCVEQGQWHLRGLAGAGRRLEHDARLRGQRGTQLG